MNLTNTSLGQHRGSEKWLVLDVRKLMEMMWKPGILASNERFLCVFSITAGLMFQ